MLDRSSVSGRNAGGRRGQLVAQSRAPMFAGVSAVQRPAVGRGERQRGVQRDLGG